VTTATPGRIVCPLTTPLDKEECLDRGTLVRLVDHLLPDLDGILVLGSSGELPLLRPSVACEALEAVVESVGGRVPVYAGVGEAGLARTLENVSAVARSRADYVVATGPFYYPVTDQDSLVPPRFPLQHPAEHGLESRAGLGREARRAPQYRGHKG
jgi:dihydrodipicolinate synthase/N-acetylneuraminate lyase